ncbi:tRNA (adenosine(37)-N6)-threonylcarbamoyltransferase complex dimerization subunit type 1 TsaB [Paenibacillus baekrokdamisoli]|uniref:tRNA (Adenosine(37)-N6)-threonylcarbamoyltransferase complex dimerization subunit type 1 TsaB n=1 Tax=Paenibacillus baekrokdamisoli TaxID=1712516 RepID=A0A3G9J825_9BACL|nr:tRNA (adenosine(37)-N6)-threonylcarbamoyltransferase complex dimerization subunit type 1 TsaB [Paenibacillus baekrokdamisoli]MBB3071444.1 tRNA threonylcarbamoyladenosine biosynthesis protein TsaB [Paenibacillus baekrokdamisoli]BBH24525.1 tRNA (adenosine(37)-N6)-threonylcarbamoyltransferase complex dimerization subunit type 1 TsaB [Paenibacillus baekrokdamisoli]
MNELQSQNKVWTGPLGPLVLALDTSTASLAAALVQGGETIGEVQSLAERNHSVHTVSIVKALLADNGVTPEQLDGIAIGCGPGSYTGMRIAVSVGKTLAWAWDKPLVGVSSLESLAYGAWQAENPEPSHLPSLDAAPRQHWFVPIMDARRGQVYTALFAASADGSWSRLAKDGIRLMHDWVDELALLTAQVDPDAAPAAIWIVGDLSLHEAEADRLWTICSRDQQQDLELPFVDVRQVSFIMEGRSVAALGIKRFKAGESDDVHTFIPNYTQLTEAEVNLRQRTSKELEGNKEGAGK